MNPDRFLPERICFMKKPLRIGKQIAAFLLCLILCLQPLFVKAAPAAKESTLTTKVHHYGYAGSAVIGQLANGTKVTVLGTYNGFYQVDCYDMVGYIATSQLTKAEDGTYCVTCQPDSSETLVLEYENMRDALSLRLSILANGDKHLGTPYVYGGSRPGAFDCSGFTYYLYSQLGISIHRRASLQLQDGIIVPREGMMVGDLVFFREAWDPNEASHVGIYAGNNTILHASSTLGISYASLDTDWFADNYLCARRVILTPNVQIPDLEAPATESGSCVVRSISGRSAH